MYKETARMASIHFECLTDLLEYPATSIDPRNQRSYKRSAVSGQSTKGSAWYGPDNHAPPDVINHALLGWPTGLQSLQTKINALDKMVHAHSTDYVQHISKVRRKRARGPQGDELDIHKVYQGQLDTAWQYRKRVEMDVQHRLVTLLIDVGGLGMADVMDSLWRGAVALRLTDELVSAGKSVRIMVGSSANGVIQAQPSKTVTTTIVVKQYNENLSLERLAAMAHLGFHRTFNFMARCMGPYAVDPNMGYTSTLLRDTAPLQLQEEVAEGHTKYVYLEQCNSASSAVVSLNNAYKQMESYSNE